MVVFITCLIWHNLEIIMGSLKDFLIITGVIITAPAA
jgi:hypothetical protein